MKLVVVTLYPPVVAGVADYGAHLAAALAADPRIEAVTVVANSAAGAPAWEIAGKQEIHRLWHRDDGSVGAAVLRAVRQARPDVVWFNLGLTMFGTRRPAVLSGLLAPVGTRLLGLPTVVTLHELPPLADITGLGLGRRSQLVAASLAVFLPLQGHRLVVTLDRYRRLLQRWYCARNVLHIPHGAWTIPQRLAPPTGDEDAILVFGTFGPHKDPALVLDAVRRLRRIRPALKLLLAGADHPRYTGFLRTYQDEAGSDGALEWLGYVPPAGLPAIFARAKVTALPARAASGSSGVVHRAAGYGRAVLVSDLPDYRALAAEEGLWLDWFPPGDTGALAAALERLLDDPGRREAMVAHNLRALTRRTPADTANAYVETFQQVCAGLPVRMRAGHLAATMTRPAPAPPEEPAEQAAPA